MIVFILFLWLIAAVLASPTHWIRAKDPADAQAIAAHFGAEYVGPVGALPGYYTVRLAVEERGVEEHPIMKRIGDSELFARPVPSAAVLVEEPLETTRDIQPEDPEMRHQWGLDVMRVRSAWQTTRGATSRVAVIDGGINSAHPDLSNNDASRAYTPITGENTAEVSDITHGTSVMSVAIGAQNTACIRGIAPAASGTAVKLLMSGMNDYFEALAFGHDLAASVVVCSYGPRDDANSRDYIGPLASAAIEHAFTSGRGGLGQPIVFAAGNGGHLMDDVAWDPYANNLYTFAIGAIGLDDTVPYFTEHGSALFAATPSCSNIVNDGTPAATGADGCEAFFCGTSISAPQAGGVIALMLDAAPELTAVDVMTAIAHTARQTDHNAVTTGAGLHWNRKFGFGVVDAAAAVERALAIRNSPRTHVIREVIPLTTGTRMIAKPGGTVQWNVARNATVFRAKLHVGIEAGTCKIAKITSMTLTTPMGTSILLHGLNRRTAASADMKFTLSATLGEHTAGTWALHIEHSCISGVFVSDNDRTFLEVLSYV